MRIGAYIKLVLEMRHNLKPIRALTKRYGASTLQRGISKVKIILQ